MAKPFSAQVSATATTVSTTPIRLKGWQLGNTTAAAAYLQIFDALVANVTVGTTTPDYVIPLSASGNVVMPMIEKPGDMLSFNTGCVIACTTTRTGNTGAAVDVFLWTEQSK